MFATVHDLAAAGVGLRLSRSFAVDTVLVVEPLACQAKTLLARVVRVETTEDGQWSHACELSTQLSAEELEGWLSGNMLGTA